jgi:hypothetical protein
VLRVWACTPDDFVLYSHPIRDRLRFTVMPLNPIELAGQDLNQLFEINRS